MTQQQTPRQIIAALSALIDQQETARASAQALANQLEGVAKTQRGELDTLRAERQALLDLLDPDKDGLTLIEAVRSLRQAQAVAEEARDAARQQTERYHVRHGMYIKSLKHYRAALEDLLAGAEQQSQSHVDVATKCRAALARVSSNKHAPTPVEETRLCPRCSRPLNNVSPGISVVAGGISICTSCLNPGEPEIARTRGVAALAAGEVEQ